MGTQRRDETRTSRLVRRVRSGFARRLAPPPPVEERQVAALRTAIQRVRSGVATQEELAAVRRLRRTRPEEAQLDSFRIARRRLRHGSASAAEKDAIGDLTGLLQRVRHREEVAGLPSYGREAIERRNMSLTELAQLFRTDKWGSHFYTPHYERHLCHLRDEPIVLLEIGVGGYAASGQGGRSLRMWKWFFQRAEIIGLDIEDKSFVDEERVHTVRGSQTDPEAIEAVIAEYGVPDVVVDDGSHVPADIIETFSLLFPRLAPGAIYAIEDTQTSYWPEWGGKEDPAAAGTTMAFVKQLVDGLNHEEYVLEGYEPTDTDRTVVGVHCYHNLVVIQKGDNAEGTNKRAVLAERYATPAQTGDLT